jgi:hypothetical protein
MTWRAISTSPYLAPPAAVAPAATAAAPAAAAAAAAASAAAPAATHGCYRSGERILHPAFYPAAAAVIAVAGTAFSVHLLRHFIRLFLHQHATGLGAAAQVEFESNI